MGQLTGGICIAFLGRGFGNIFLQSSSEKGKSLLEFRGLHNSNHRDHPPSYFQLMFQVPKCDIVIINENIYIWFSSH